MADPAPTANGNGATEHENEAQVGVIAQYIKDLSVENPSAPQVFQWEVQPALDVQFNINVESPGDDVQEVTLKIDVAARSDNGVHFIVDLSYAGLFALRGVPQEALAPFLLIEAPRLLFPFARQIVADAVVNTGFPPLYLEPIDFAAAYTAQVEAAQQQAVVNGDDSSAAPLPADDDSAIPQE